MDIQQQYEMLFNMFDPLSGARLKNELSVVLRTFRFLKPKQETYIHNNGSSEMMVCLEGTLPITFKGSHYYIPIIIWIPRTYPTAAPICYVTPTKDMEIKRGHTSVEPSGQCQFPCLQQWNSNQSIMHILMTMSQVFSDEPPVFSVTKQAVNAASQEANNLQNSQVFPVANFPTGPALNQSRLSGYSQSLPPPPTYNDTMKSKSLGVPPPLQVPTPQNSGPMNGSGFYAYPISPPVNPSPPGQPPHILSRPVQPPLNIPQPPPSVEKPPSYAQSHALVNIKKRSDMEDTLRKKLEKHIQTLGDQNNTELERLFKIQGELSENSQKIADVINVLNENKGILGDNLQILNQSELQIDNVFAYINEDSFAIDDFVRPSDPLSNQMYQLVSEDLAIEDTIYVLDRGLNSGKIDLESYLKAVRSSSRQQFIIKATINKVAYEHKNPNGFPL